MKRESKGGDTNGGTVRQHGREKDTREDGANNAHVILAVHACAVCSKGQEVKLVSDN